MIKREYEMKFFGYVIFYSLMVKKLEETTVVLTHKICENFIQNI